ncbi:MAG TPA: dihydrolipoyl dehydrogenase [Candidatus Dormibacteraeota bacterium]|nr:dihydrolipoyl dehydrogenase [Candidatus Dormibacteraeota bacterium]
MHDIAVVGGGPGGYVAAIRAAQLGMKTVLVEKEATLGGVCLNWGCIPSKSLLRNAEVLRLVNDLQRFGISVSDVRADYAAAVDRSRQVVDRTTKGVAFLMRKNGIEVRRARGTLRSEQVVACDDGGQDVRAQQIILATGARPRSIPGVTVDRKRVLTSRELLETRAVPPRAVIIGGGAIGCEFAYVLAAYGSKVTVVEMLPRLLPQEDEDVSRELERAFERQGIERRTGTGVAGVESGGSGATVHLQGGEAIDCDLVLVAIGVVPNVEDMGLEDVGVATGKNGITVDPAMRTSVPGVYAIGDCVGPPLLAHAASAEGVVAAEAAAGRETQPLDAVQMPRCTYCVPQVASVGYTEQQAREKVGEVKVGRFPFSASARAHAAGDATGFVKVVTDAGGVILGTHMIGAEVTELLPEMVMAPALGVTAEQFERFVHAHPTLSEAVKHATMAAVGLAIDI